MCLSMKKGGKKSDNLMINLKLKIRQHSLKNSKFKRINKNNNKKKKGKKKMPKCTCLTVSVRKLLISKTSKKYKKCQALNKKSKSSCLKLRNLLRPCRKKLNKKTKLNILN